MPMPPMLAYTIQSQLSAGGWPVITIGQGATKKRLTPGSQMNDSYWIAIMDATNPVNKVQDFLFPGSNNHAVPAGLDTYMSNPAYLFALVTNSLSVLHVPQGDFFNYLVAHGAGRELKRLEQINTSLGCGSIGNVSYLLTGQGGQAGSPSPAYEQGSIHFGVLLTMSLMPLPSGQPPYTICDSETFVTA